MGTRHAGDAAIVVGSVQTLGRNGSKRILDFKAEDFAVVVADECHIVPTKSYCRVLNHFGLLENGRTDRPLLIGLTATPRRSDGKCLTNFFNQQISEYQLQDAITDGWLSDLVGIKIKTNVDLNRVKVKSDDFDPVELERAVNIKLRNKLVVEGWKKHALNLPTVVFCTSIQHAKLQAQEFEEAGFKFEAIWGTDPERDRKLADLVAGKITGLTTCSMLGIGWDYPNLQCICMAAPTKSELKYVQWVGRGTRLQPGIENLVEAKKQALPLYKDHCLVLDFVDNSTKHTLVTLPLVFGLNPAFDLEGQSATKTAALIRSKKIICPLVDFSKLEVIGDIDTLATEVDLFQGVEGQSVPSWARRSSANMYRYNMARHLASNIMKPEQTAKLTEAQVNAVFRAKLTELRRRYQSHVHVS